MKTQAQQRKVHLLVAEWWPVARRVSVVCRRCGRQVIAMHVDEALRSFCTAFDCKPRDKVVRSRPRSLRPIAASGRARAT